MESLHNINSTVRDYAVRAKSKKIKTRWNWGKYLYNL
jgi:hypothetical protein